MVQRITITKASGIFPSTLRSEQLASLSRLGHQAKAAAVPRRSPRR
jgi:hypothetical protein